MQTKYKKHILIGGFALVIISVGIVAYVVSSDVLTQQETSTSQNNDAEAIKTKGELSVVEYAKWCGTHRINQGASWSYDMTYKQAKDILKKISNEADNIIPPPEIQEYHTVEKRLIEMLYENVYKDQPDNEIVTEAMIIEIIDNLDSFEVPLYLVGTQRLYIISTLFSGIQNTLLENGCIHESDLEYESPY